jgi:hypothetical protein
MTLHGERFNIQKKKIGSFLYDGDTDVSLRVPLYHCGDNRFFNFRIRETVARMYVPALQLRPAVIVCI